MNKGSMKILLAAGGTGGHIIPAIAFGLWLNEKGDQPIWLCGSRPLEWKIFTAHGVTPHKLSLEGSPLGVSGFRSLKRWGQLVKAYFEARSVLKKNNVQRCVLFSGYLSLPALLAAKSLGLPIVMQEQNVIAGRVTRFAAALGVPIAATWERCDGLAEDAAIHTGLPLRHITLIDKKNAQCQLLGTALPPNEKLMIILGGSLGSGGLKSVLQTARPMIKLSGYRVLCMGIAPENKPFPEAIVHEPCWDMTPVYSAADVILCRAGASTLAELEALKLPAIIVPWLRSAGNHQIANAEWFSKLTGAPVFLENGTAEDFAKAFTAVQNFGCLLNDDTVMHPTEDVPRDEACDEPDMDSGAEKLYEVLRCLKS